MTTTSSHNTEIPLGICGTIDRFEGDRAVVVLQTGGEAIVPRELVHDMHEGDAVTLVALPHHAATQAREALARELLNRLIKND